MFGKQRFLGFAICMVAGITCTLLSLIVFSNPIKFGITFTLGNLLSLGSTAFIIGPKQQVLLMLVMLHPARLYATAIYLASIIFVLFSALYVHNKLLTLLAIILEIGVYARGGKKPYNSIMFSPYCCCHNLEFCPETYL
ncbi:hypothetical protein UlMin_030601 [Ulmus minor]